MKLGSLKRVMMSDVPGAEPWFQTFLNHYNPFATQVTQALGQQISISDNTNCAFMDVDLFHGVERIVTAPVANCAGVVARKAAEIVSGKPTQNAVAVDLSVREIDGIRFGLTARFPPPPNYVLVRATGAQAIAHNTLTIMTYAATPVVSIGTAITYNGTDTLTCAIAGVFDVVAQNHIVAAAGGTRATFIFTNAGTRSAGVEIAGQAGGDLYASVTEPSAVLAVGNTRRMQVYQNQTAVAALNTGNNSYPYLSMRMIDRLPAFKARVSCLFLGV